MSGTRISEGRKKIPAETSYKEWRNGIDKAKSKRQNDLSAGNIDAAAATKTGNFKDEAEKLRQKFQTQRAQGASAAEMETTIKAAGELVINEVKAIKIYDLPPEERIDINGLRNTCESRRANQRDIVKSASDGRDGRAT